MFYQQGDVIIEVAQIPKDAKPKEGSILAEGESTGHAHRVECENAQLLELGSRLFLRIMAGNAKVVHEEHAEIELLPGEYEVRGVQEYDHFAEETRRVQD